MTAQGKNPDSGKPQRTTQVPKQAPAEAPNPATLRSIKRMRIAIWILAGIALAFGIFIYIQQMPPPNGKYDSFAKCIANTSTTFYGAWWCPHCREQKNEFGDASKYLPYIECANPDESENATCKALGITSYPTWFFPDGTTSTGVATLEALSQKTACPLPTSSNPQAT